MSDTALVPLDHFNKMAVVFRDSKFFKVNGDENQQLAMAVVKMVAGRELGMTEFESMRSLHAYEGKVELTASAIASRIKKTGRYDYSIDTLSEKGCTISFYGPDPRTGTSRIKLGSTSFNDKDAQAAGLLGKDVWKKYAQDMYFARALSRGARQHCPDVFNGAIYTEGEVIEEATVTRVPEEGDSPFEAAPPPPPPAPLGKTLVVITPEQEETLKELLEDCLPPQEVRAAIAKGLVMWRAGLVSKEDRAAGKTLHQGVEEAIALVGSYQTAMVSDAPLSDLHVPDGPLSDLPFDQPPGAPLGLAIVPEPGSPELTPAPGTGTAENPSATGGITPRHRRSQASRSKEPAPELSGPESSMLARIQESKTLMELFSVGTPTTPAEQTAFEARQEQLKQTENA